MTRYRSVDRTPCYHLRACNHVAVACAATIAILGCGSGQSPVANLDLATDMFVPILNSGSKIAFVNLSELERIDPTGDFGVEFSKTSAVRVIEKDGVPWLDVIVAEVESIDGFQLTADDTRMCLSTAISPSEEKVAVSVVDTAPEVERHGGRPCEIIVRNLRTGEVVRKQFDIDYLHQIEWSPDGSKIVCLGNSVEVGSIDRILTLNADTLAVVHESTEERNIISVGWLAPVLQYELYLSKNDTVVLDEYEFPGRVYKRSTNWHVPGLIGGRYLNTGPDGLVHLYVRSLIDPEGRRGPPGDGWSYSLVLDPESRSLYRLPPTVSDDVRLSKRTY